MTSTTQLILVGAGRGSRVAHYSRSAYGNSVCGRSMQTGYSHTTEWFWHGDRESDRAYLDRRAVCKQCAAIRARMAAEEAAQVEEPAAPVEAGTRVAVQPQVEVSERIQDGMVEGWSVAQVEDTRHVHAPETNGAYSAYSRHGYGVCTCGRSIYLEPFGGWLTLVDLGDAYAEHFERGYGNLLVGDGVAVHGRIGRYTWCGAAQRRRRGTTPGTTYTVAPVTCRSCLKHAR